MWSNWKELSTATSFETSPSLCNSLKSGVPALTKVHLAAHSLCIHRFSHLYGTDHICNEWNDSTFRTSCPPNSYQCIALLNMCTPPGGTLQLLAQQRHMSFSTDSPLVSIIMKLRLCSTGFFILKLKLKFFKQIYSSSASECYSITCLPSIVIDPSFPISDI